jgi:hypothetical protein
LKCLESRRELIHQTQFGVYPPVITVGAAMPTSEDYKDSAEECRRLAALTDDERERATLLQMACQWQRLADYKAKQESGGALG